MDSPDRFCIRQVFSNKKQYLDLLLLADEQESMIDRYLDRGDMFVLFDHGPISVGVVTEESACVCELKNLATDPRFQSRGFGRAMVEFLKEHYRSHYQTMLVGTGDNPQTLSFYGKCGFVPSHRIPDFFTDNYDHPIFENGVQLRDMLVLKIPL